MRRFEGKLFGAALGFSFGGPIGAIIGAVVGHFVDTSLDKKGRRGRGVTGEKELAFITSLILLLVETAKADGAVTEDEKETIRSFFRQQLGYDSRELEFINRIIEEAVFRNTDINDVCQSIRWQTSYEERLFLIQLTYRVAISDGKLSKTEEELIARAANYLGINSYDFAAIRNSFNSYRTSTVDSESFYRKRTEVQDPYSILGIGRDASNEEVHKAFRNLANKYHPDKVSHLGKEFIELATEKFTQIKNAYEAIKKERGI